MSLAVGRGSISTAVEYELAALSEWDSISAGLAADPSTAEFFEREASSQSGPVSRDLFEILIPY
jgi:hypothetical protein